MSTDSPNSGVPEGVDIPSTEEPSGGVSPDVVLARLGGSWVLMLVLGLFSIVAGIVLLAFPIGVIKILAVILGIWLLLSGFVQIVIAFDAKLNVTSRILSAITGLLGIALGIVAFSSTANRVELLIIFISLWWIFRGITILFGGAGNRTSGSSGFAILAGLLSIIAGIVVLVWPIGSLSVLVVFAGLWFIVLGLFEAIAAFSIRSKVNKAAKAI